MELEGGPIETRGPIVTRDGVRRGTNRDYDLPYFYNFFHYCRSDSKLDFLKCKIGVQFGQTDGRF